MKACSRCGEEKPLGAFGRDPRRKSGLKPQCRACENAGCKAWRTKNLEHTRKISCEAMKRRRQDPAERGVILERNRRAYANGGKERQRESLKRRREQDFFRYKATRGSMWLTAGELERLWNNQAGRCALTGRPLDRDDAHVDHKIPRSRGGQDIYENAQWLCSAANRGKRNLMDEEFVALCLDVVKHNIGTQLLMHIQNERIAA